MFKQPTVLILGAGASCHYGYPTGEQLILKVCELAERFAKIVNPIKEDPMRFEGKPYRRNGKVIMESKKNILSDDNSLFPLLNLKTLSTQTDKQQALYDVLSAFAKKIKSLDPLNIDTFLRDNKQLREIGKTLIASVLLGCEKNSIKIPYNDHAEKSKGDKDSGKRDNWYRFLIHALASAGSKEELLKIATDRKLIIITFNYDVSLEYHLYKALSEIEAIGEQTAKQFMKELKIIHVYGELRKIDWSADEPLEGYGADNTIKLAMQCAEGIETIDSDKQQKLADSEDIAIAKSALANASRIVILGYGFDDANNRMLGLENILHWEKQDHPSEEVRKYNAIGRSIKDLIYELQQLSAY